MTWRQQIATFDPYGSRAEVLLLQELHRRGLHPNHQERISLVVTVPDYNFPDHDSPIMRRLFYLDGPVHLRWRVEEKDEQVNKCLECLGVPFRRFSYRTPISQARLRQIADAIALENTRSESRRFTR